MTATIDLSRNETEGVTFPKGQPIFSAGDPADVVYVVLEGEVELSIRGKVVEILGQGGVLGEMALMEHTLQTATATAISDCKLVAIPGKRFLFMVQQTPHFYLQIMRVIAERLRRVDERL
jgi:CRP/FNR family transcriptional regulator, cyclic AMP receptor protein